MSSTVAIIELGGKQHLVTPGALVVVNRLEAAVGDAVNLSDMLSDKTVQVKVVSHGLGKKVNGLKFKPKTRYLKRYGHRQHQTTVEIVSIGDSKPAAEKAAVAPKTEVKKAAPKKAAVKKPAAKVTKKSADA